ncbi:RND transporter [Caloranaerobacter azorensis H53214]|uniref:RND transporter n=1 Tax=Caloranaerobacter azorensis H53214 TaxID=1156417 RepID=A0A096BJL8_9FIRM|nr:efflux RND transporter periplasmic adaptor subunit [Caloranaerobacter azorensis]KGG80958.1 RND transporter [Caloranaerobacter azorensis H53214]
MLQRVMMIVLILLIVLGGGLYAYKQLMPAEVKEVTGPVYATKKVVRGNISVGVETSGRLDATHGGGIRVPENIDLDGLSINYIIDEILVKEGDHVKKDQLIARLKSTQIEKEIDSKKESLKMKKEQLAEMTGTPLEEIDNINPAKGITVTAPISGRIINLKVEEGDKLELGYLVCRIVDDSKFKVRAKLTPVEIKRVKEGQKVVLRFSNFDNLYEGTITEVSQDPVPDKDKDGNPKGFVYWITVVAKNPGLVQPGMEVYVGLPDNNNPSFANFFVNKASVDSFIEEKRVINRAEAIVTEVFVHDMEVIKKGEPILSMAGADTQKMIQDKLEEIKLLELEISKLKSSLENLEIRSKLDGIIAYISIEEGETVRPGRWIGSVFNTNEMEVWTQVDDIDIVNVKQDAPVKVTVDAIPGEVFEGKVIDVSTRGENNNGITKYDVIIQVKGGPKLKPGMQANVYIDAGSAENVLLVPIEAVFEEDGKFMVEVLEPNGTVKAVPVKLGLMNDRYAEVKSGLKEGDLVITGSSADILPSEHIKSNDTLLPDKNNNSKEQQNTDSKTQE